MKPAIDLRRGRWESVLADVECDAQIGDPPFGARVHDSEATRNDGVDADGLAPDYAAWTPADVAKFVKHWSPRTRGWMCNLTSHDLIPAWEKAFAKARRLMFAPVPCVIRGMTVRMQGDGPSNWTVYLVTARPRTKAMAAWGTLDGAYVGNRSPESSGGRGKPAWLTHAIVRDYTRPGDLVCDPMAGWGTFLCAAKALGRRAIGAESDPSAYEVAEVACARPLQGDLFAQERAA